MGTKKSLTFCFRQDCEVDFDFCWCPSGSVQSETDRQSDLYRRTGLIQYRGEKSSTVLLYSGCRHQYELSGRHDLHTTHPNAVSPSRPRTQRTLACAGALPYGRVRQHFLAKRHLFVCPCHHAFPRYFLLHHRAEHGTAKGYVQG